MSCHQCWSEYYRMSKMDKSKERERRARFKVRVKVLMDVVGLMYGQAVWQASGEESNAKNDT